MFGGDGGGKVGKWEREGDTSHCSETSPPPGLGARRGPGKRGVRHWGPDYEEGKQEISVGNSDRFGPFRASRPSSCLAAARLLPVLLFFGMLGGSSLLLFFLLLLWMLLSLSQLSWWGCTCGLNLFPVSSMQFHTGNVVRVTEAFLSHLEMFRFLFRHWLAESH